MHTVLASPLLDDPLPVVNYFLGHFDDASQSTVETKWSRNCGGRVNVLRSNTLGMRGCGGQGRKLWKVLVTVSISPPVAVLVGVRVSEGGDGVAQHNIGVVEDLLHLHGAIGTSADIISWNKQIQLNATTKTILKPVLLETSQTQEEEWPDKALQEPH